jgi:sigma-E factor negative regulatory protein RseA
MVMPLEDKQLTREDWSAWVDGELPADQQGSACSQWRHDHDVRADWHTYHLIGDVLRSEDLASDGEHDAAFLRAFRARLALEPVVLAPVAPADAVAEPMSRSTGRARASWRSYSAVAAGFVAVAGVVVVLRGTPTVAPGADTLAAAAPPSTVQAVAAVPVTEVRAGVPTPNPTLVAGAPDGAAAVAPPSVIDVSGPVWRDSGLDQYLAAHKRFVGSSALAVPSTFLRGATVEAPRR